MQYDVKPSLPKPSSEQKLILKKIGKGENIYADCVAGSGKTTTVLLLANMYPDKNILQITYNKELKFDVRQKIISHGINNIEVHSYHSLGVKFYYKDAHNDYGLNSIVNKNILPRTDLLKFDILVIDEAQDMSLLYYKLIIKFIKDLNNPSLQLLVLGDKYQSIYTVKGADKRYLTLSPKLYQLNLERAFLSTSYRVTNQIADFVNNVMLNQNRIKAVKDGAKVKYMRHNSFNDFKKIAKIITNLMIETNLKPDDIFILAGSIKSDKTPIRKLENELSSLGLPIYYPTSDEQKIDETLIKGKVVFSNFHQSKGRERKLVIIYGFDSSYFEFYAKDADPHICPETLYVATTRAKEYLILLEHFSKGPLPFLKKSHTEMKALNYIQFTDHDFKPTFSKVELKNNTVNKTSVTDIIKYLQEDNINILTLLVNKIFKNEVESECSINIPSKIKIKEDVYEEVSDINGIVLPAIHEYQQRGTCRILENVHTEYNNLVDNKQHNFLQKAYEQIKKELEYSRDFVYLGIIYVSLNEKIYHRINQITKYNWLKSREIDDCLEILQKYLPKKTKYERDIVFESLNFPQYGTVIINGRLDAYNENVVWEIKCVDSLQLEHYLQLVVYAWLWRQAFLETKGYKQFKILNIRTGQVDNLDTTSIYIDEIIKILVENKFGTVSKIDDDKFIIKNLKEREIINNTTLNKAPITYLDDDSESDIDIDENNIQEKSVIIKDKLPSLPKSDSESDDEIHNKNKRKSTLVTLYSSA